MRYTDGADELLGFRPPSEDALSGARPAPVFVGLYLLYLLGEWRLDDAGGDVRRRPSEIVSNESVELMDSSGAGKVGKKSSGGF